MRARKWDNGLLFLEENETDLLANSEGWAKTFERLGYKPELSKKHLKHSKEQRATTVAKRIVAIFIDEMLTSLIYQNDVLKLGKKMRLSIKSKMKRGYITARGLVPFLFLENNDYAYVGRNYYAKLRWKYKLILEKEQSNGHLYERYDK